MKEKTEFKVGDKVKFGDAEGVVRRVYVDETAYPILALFEGNGKLYFNQPEGFPRLTLVSRPEKFVEKEVYQPIEASVGYPHLSYRIYSNKEDALKHNSYTIGYAVSKVFIKESET